MYLVYIIIQIIMFYSKFENTAWWLKIPGFYISDPDQWAISIDLRRPGMCPPSRGESRWNCGKR